MAPQLTTCRIRLYNGTQLIDLKDHVPTTPETRKQWATAILTHFRTPTNEPRTRIRPWDLLAHLDGTVGRLQAPPPAEASLDIESVYPIRYRLPPPVPTGGSEQEKLVVRAEKFAMRSLLYEVLTSRKPYEELADDEVQQRFAAGEFPADADALGLPAMLPNDDEDEEEEQASSSQAMVVKNEGTSPPPRPARAAKPSSAPIRTRANFTKLTVRRPQDLNPSPSTSTTAPPRTRTHTPT